MHGCTYPVNETITLDGYFTPYYVRSESFLFDDSLYFVRSVPIRCEMDSDNILYWALYHIFVEIGSEDTNLFYCKDEAYWTCKSPGKYKIKIDSEIIGGESIYDHVEGKIKMKGDGDFAPECSSFFIDPKIQIQLKF